MDDLFNKSIEQEKVSFVTLSSDWSRVAKLLILAGLAVIGSIGNIYMISSVMIEDHLKKRGNTFIVNVALADLLVTSVVMPASAVIILAGFEDPPEVCRTQWFLTIVSCLVTVLSLAAIAAENYARLCLSPEVYAHITTSRITTTVLIIWAVSILAVAAKYWYNLGPDYCTTKVRGTFLYQAIIAGLIFAIPAILATIFYTRTILQVRLARAHPSFKPPVAFSWDYSLMKTNMFSFLTFFIFWLPFAVLLFVDSVKSISVKLFYNLAWLALSRSCINNLIYCGDRHFRNAYINIFHYCCCKTSVAFSRRSRGEAVRPTGEVRVHIIPGYNMYSYTSPQRANQQGSSKRTTASRPQRPVHQHNTRDVYEL